MTKWHDEGLANLSGPFMKKAGGLNGVLEEGGTAVFKTSDFEEATQISNDDPTVKSGMLNVEVKMMWVSSHRSLKTSGRCTSV